MADLEHCPCCDIVLNPLTPAGLCPRCLLQAALMVDPADLAPGLDPASPQEGPAGAGGASILTSIASLSGAIPRVNLPDTDGGTAPAEVGADPGEALDWLGLPARYEIRGEIARGGMGAILKGRDTDLGRDVAVKVLLDQHRDRPEMVRRFLEEAQIGGQLQHPGIVPVYELGVFADGRPFFSMKLVRGRTLATLLEGRNAPDDDRPRWLSVLLQVCQTVAYAHARGVIHRDLKPSNVMVGPFGEVQVMDWGLAKARLRVRAAEGAPTGRHLPARSLDATLNGGDSDLSRAGSAMGTPAYMAPEQARGETDVVDERADVFALGSILCEILTGRPVFVGRDSAEIRARAERADLSDALSRLDACGAEAELIDLARACLAAEPTNRPRDAGVLAERITDYLDGVAQRLRRAELARFEERARRRLTTALAAAVLAVGVLAGSGFLWMQHQRSERRTATARLFDEALDRARVLWGVAAAAPVGEPAGWAEAIAEARRAEDLLRQGEADPSLRRRAADVLDGLRRGQAEARSRAEQVDIDRRLLAALVDVSGTAADDPDGSATDAAYAAAFRAAGVDLSDLTTAEAGALIRARPPDVALAMVTALDDWAALRRGRRHDPAGARRLVDVAGTADSDPWRARLREALGLTDRRARLTCLRELAAVARVEALPAISVSLLGSALADTGDLEPAADLLRRAQLRNPGEVRLHLELARVMNATARAEEAIRHYTAARAIRPETAHDLAHLLVRRGDPDAAIAVFRDLTRRRPANAFHTICLVHVLWTQSKFDEANAALEAAIEANRQAIRLRPDDANAYLALGIILQSARKPEDAIAALRETIRLMPNESTARIHLGRILEKTGNLRAAVEAFREAIRLRPDHGEAYVRLGDLLENEGSHDEAVEAYHEALRHDPDGSAAHAGLGRSLLRRGRWQEGADEYELARERSTRAADGAVFYFPMFHQSDDDVPWYFCAVAQLRSGRLDRYRTLRGEILARFADGSGNIERVARVALMLPGAPEVVAPAVRLAESALRIDPEGKFALYTAGLAAYRSGQYELALDRLRRSRRTALPGDKDFREAYNALSDLVRAMSLSRLSRTGPAKEALKQAERLMADHVPTETSDAPYPFSWQEWAHCEIIHREARAVLRDCELPMAPIAP